MDNLIELSGGHKLSFRIRAEAIQFYSDIFDKHVYDSFGIDLCAGDVIFDIGANIGLFTLYATRFPGVTTYAFEPAPDTFALLEQNVAYWRCRATCFNFGIGAHAENRQFTYYPRATGMSSFYANDSEDTESLRIVMRRTIAAISDYPSDSRLELLSAVEPLLARRLKKRILNCRIETVSRIMRRYALRRIDLMKIDVQKSELDVLLGVEEEDWPLILQVAMEVHDIHGRLDKIRHLLELRGYEIAISQDALYRDSRHYNLYGRRPTSRLGMTLR